MEFVHSDRLFYACIFMEKKLLGLALAMAWGVLPVCLRGQDREMDLQEVEVSAPSGKMYSELGRVLTVLDREEIERLPVRTVDELLDQVAGLDVRQRGTGGVQADLSIRGGTADQVLVLLNGVNVTNPQTGHYNLDVPVNLADVERVEVLQGSAARVLGVNAFSGAVNIVTGQARRDYVQAGLTTGSYNTMGQEASASYGAGGFRAFASASHQRSDGYMDNTDYDMANGFLHLTQRTERAGDFGLQGGVQYKDYGANGFYSLDYPDQHDRTRTFFAALTWSLNRAHWLWRGQLYWQEHHDRYELIRHSPVGRNLHQTDVGGGKLSAAWLSAVGKFTFGLDVRDEHIFSTGLGEPMGTPKPVPFERDCYFTYAKNRLTSTLFVDYAGQRGRLAWSLGGAASHVTDFGLLYAGGADVGFEVADGLRLVASYNSAVRLPSFTDLYYQSAVQAANPHLRPETSHTFELGAQYRHGGWRVEADVYYRLGDNIIDWVKLPDSTRWESRNLTDVNALGGDAGVRYDFGRQAFVRSVSLGYSYTHLNKLAAGFDSKYALDYLKHKCRLTLEHRVWNRLGMVWNASLNDRAGTYADHATGEPTAYRPYFLLDAKLAWTQRNFEVYAEVRNILDTHYADYAGLPQPGVNWGAGVKLRIDN